MRTQHRPRSGRGNPAAGFEVQFTRSDNCTNKAAVQKIVSDTSAVLAVCLQEATRRKVIARTKGAELIAPSSLPLEIPNALSSKFKQAKLELEEAYAALERFEKIPIQLIRVDLREATRLAHELDIYAYDAYPVQTARQHGAPILSLDGGLCEAAGRAGVETIHIT